MGDARIFLRSYFKETAIFKRLRRAKRIKSAGDISKAEQQISIHCAKDMSEKERCDLIADMVRMQKQYRYGYDEYFLYRFPEKSDSERLKFVADTDRVDIVECLNKAKNQPLFDDKARTYKRYFGYFKREMCIIGGGVKDFDVLKGFLEKHSRIIVKPADSSCGNGIFILDISKLANVNEDLERVLKNNSRGLIAEELIVQDGRMAQLHPQSVNTLRVTTLRMNDRVEVLHPFLKVGRGENVVDNGGAGGILCVMDPVTGVVTHTADKYGVNFDVHPDNGERLVGFAVPEWDKAIDLVKQLACVTPSNRYTGWDIALADNGWVLVEANARGQFIGWQIPTQVGFKEEICKLLLEISPSKYAKLVKFIIGDNK